MATFGSRKTSTYDMPSHPAVMIVFFVCFIAFFGAIVFAVAGPEEMEDLKLKVVGAACLLIAVSAVAGGIYGYRSAASVRSWVRAHGVVIQSDVHSYESTTTDYTGERRRTTTMTMYRPKIVFEYSYRDRKYQGGRIALNEVASSDPSTAGETAARYPVGREILIFVNPESPDQSVVEFDPKSPRMHLYISFGMAFAFGLAGLFMLFLN